jgi:hypothetical protein
VAKGCAEVHVTRPLVASISLKAGWTNKVSSVFHSLQCGTLQVRSCNPCWLLNTNVLTPVRHCVVLTMKQVPLTGLGNTGTSIRRPRNHVIKKPCSLPTVMCILVVRSMELSRCR